MQLINILKCKTINVSLFFRKMEPIILGLEIEYKTKAKNSEGLKSAYKY